jgi:serine/threonine protein kinase
LKPSNVLLSEGMPKIIDFGYAEIVGVPKPKMYYNVGSPSYMAP